MRAAAEGSLDIIASVTLPKIMCCLQPCDQLIRRQHRYGAWLDPHDASVQHVLNFVFEAHHRA